MKIEFDNVWARVYDASSDDVAWISEYLSSETTVFTGHGKPDKRSYLLYDAVNRAFPSGLVLPVAKAARETQRSVEWIDIRVRKTLPEFGMIPLLGSQSVSPLFGSGWLRGYQVDAVEAMCRRGRGLIKAPTGSGKTEIWAGATKVIPCEWLFVVHRSDLVKQAASRYLARTGEIAGIFEDGRWKPGTCNVTVATFQSIYSGLRRADRKTIDFLDKMEALNVDESHAQPASSFYLVSMNLRNAYYRFGMSGTPLDRKEYESMRTIGALGPLIYRIKLQTLLDAGVLSKARIRMLRVKQDIPIDVTGWSRVYKQYVVNSQTRNKLIIDIVEQKARRPCLVFVDEVKHGKELLKLLKSRVYAHGSVDFVHGDDPIEIRQQKIDALIGYGGIDVLIATVIFQEGIDIPQLKSVVNAAGKASTIACIQRLGRGMRTCGDGDNTFDFWDIDDLGHKWLERHSDARRLAYVEEGHDVEIVRDL